MPERMASSPLREACRPDCTANGALNHRCVQVIPPLDARVPFSKATRTDVDHFYQFERLSVAEADFVVAEILP